MRGAATIQRTIQAPREEVYGWLQDVANYSQWMRDVREVHILDDRRSIWSLHGPSGPIEWETEVTIQRPHSAFAFCTRGAGTVGVARIQLRDANGGTEMRVQRFLGMKHRDRKLEDWWNPSLRLSADFGHLEGLIQNSLRDLGAGRPNAIGFDFKARGF